MNAFEKADLARYLDEVCERAVEKFGRESQLSMLQEECGELIAAINHYRRGRISDHVLRFELVDVAVTLRQAFLIIGDDEEFQKLLRHKLERLDQQVIR